MTVKNDQLFSEFIFSRLKPLKFLGVGLVVIGNFLPWQCTGDLADFCYSGIDLSFLSIFTIHPNWILLGIIIAIMLVALVINGAFRFKPTTLWLIAGVFSWIFLYFEFSDTQISFDNALAPFSIIYIWLIFQPLAESSRFRKVQVVIGLGLIFRIIYEISLLPPGNPGGAFLGSGLPIMGTGLILVLASLMIKVRG